MKYIWLASIIEGTCPTFSTYHFLSLDHAAVHGKYWHIDFDYAIDGSNFPWNLLNLQLISKYNWVSSSNYLFIYLLQVLRP